MVQLQFFVVNAFSSTPFRGNPATVVIVPREFLVNKSTAADHTEYFQQLAVEIGQVETVFVLPPCQPKTDYCLRFFTKRKEMAFCGHATLAAAHVLSTEQKAVQAEEIGDVFYFSTNTGVIVVTRRNKTYEMDLSPSAAVPISQDVDTIGLRSKLLTAIGLEKASSITEILFHEPSQNLIVVLARASDVVLARPNSDHILGIPFPSIAKLTITAAPVMECDDENESKWKQYDFITRLFAPWIGIHEDAVSGASHAILAQYWRSRSQAIREKSALLCFQPSPRGGEIMLRTNGNRVGVSGEVVTICAGNIVSHL